MAIFVPGKRDRHNRPLRKGGREVVAILSLTAMVDMFTVLVVFLLQNYKVEAITFEQAVKLPEASAIKKLKPANVVSISDKKVMFNNYTIGTPEEIEKQEDWMIEKLYDLVSKELEKQRQEFESTFRNKLKVAVSDPEEVEKEKKKLEADLTRFTVQADKELEFLTIKKILYTVTEAGAGEINFAVLQKPEDQKE